jgi:late competence protein required for DNA uptake (superfamily II DNA/RNA helicase)
MCPRCNSGDLKLDEEETRKSGILTYYCDRCDLLMRISSCGEKERGWRTKKMLKEKEELKNCPF